MNEYIQVIRDSFVWFPFVALLFTAPYAFYNYHKYGSLWSFRILVVYSLILYLMTVYFLVILPLPSREAVTHMTGREMNLDLFGVLRDFLKEMPSHGIWHNPALWQFAFNILMLVPLGMYLRYWFGFSLGKSLLISFGLSLFFELTQLSGLYGLYPRPYRLFDVDDLLANTLGGLLGWVVMGPVMKILPARSQVDAASLKAGEHVSALRRILAAFVDGLCLVFTVFWCGRWWPEMITLYILISMACGRTLGMMTVSLQVESGHGLTGRLLRGIFGLAGLLWLPLLAARLWFPFDFAGILFWLLLCLKESADLITGHDPWYDTWTDSRIVSSIRQ
ncbi:VanZ family protein [uncultured Faecalibaculum sp.]|uniref:VanZ family protein n=1 Tax=uncultured Faecalibaculum sp. TaxID=1729681 RepID=UPI00260E801A|nr:VanZ family protein [uncultured Faecalibaculum sp.]